MSAFQGRTKTFFIAQDLDRHLDQPGSLVAIYWEDWQSDKAVMEGWRGPKMASEDFARTRLKPYECPNLMTDMGGYWECLRGTIIG